MKILRYIKQKIHNKPYYIAEIANSHAGNIGLLKKSVIELNKTKVNAIKFQIYRASELISKNHKMFKTFKNLEFSNNEWVKFFNFLQKFNSKEIFFDIFGIESFNFLINNFNNISCFKIHSSDIYNTELIEKISCYNKPIILSCGGISSHELKYTLKLIKKNNKLNIILMNGFQAYPTNMNDLILNKKLLNQKKNKNVILGYADHTDTDLAEKNFVPFYFFDKGVKIIEKHYTVNRSLKLNDYYSSIEKNEFDDFIDLGNKIFSFIKSNNDTKYEFNKSELKYRREVVKTVHAKHPIKKGEKLSNENTCLIRPVKSVVGQLKKLEDVLNKKAKKNILPSSIIKISDIG